MPLKRLEVSIAPRKGEVTGGPCLHVGQNPTNR